MTQLIKKIVIKGKLTLLSGLHIGGTNTAMGIGGPDKLVVRNPIDNKPYIPGSSLKGKLRSLIELKDGTLGPNDGPSNSPEARSCKLFGMSADAGSKGAHASRIIVRDAPLNEESCAKLTNTDMLYTESKTEVSIDRITSKANPRTFERVPAGAQFDVEFIINVFTGEDEAALLQTLNDAIRLLEDDYLGGNGSRGYGQVKFENLKREERTYDQPHQN